MLTAKERPIFPLDASAKLRWYQEMKIYIFAIDDHTSSLVDFNDGVFGVALNLRPAAFEITPVPEPSTYALFGAVALCLIVGVRRFKQRR